VEVVLVVVVVAVVVVIEVVEVSTYTPVSPPAATLLYASSTPVRWICQGVVSELSGGFVRELSGSCNGNCQGVVGVVRVLSGYCQCVVLTPSHRH